MINLVDVEIKTLLLAIIGLLGVWLLRRSSAAVRHLALAVSLIGVCLVPSLSPVVPTWQVPFLRVSQPASSPVTSIAAPIKSVSAAPVVSNPAPDPKSILLWVWLTISGVLLSLIATRLIRLKMLEKRLRMVADPGLHITVTEFCRKANRHVLYLEGNANEPPMTWGVSRPVLLLPSSAQDWPGDRLRAVILHELAHIERSDWLMSLGAEIICAVFWFNPLVWVLRKQMLVESEAAADDRVLTSGFSAPTYAAQLLDLVKEMKHFPKDATVAVAMARPGRLSQRVCAILEVNRSRRATRGTAAFGMLAAVGLIAATLAAAGPTVIKEAVRGETASSFVPKRSAAPTPDIESQDVPPPVEHVRVAVSQPAHKHRFEAGRRFRVASTRRPNLSLDRISESVDQIVDSIPERSVSAKAEDKSDDSIDPDDQPNREAVKKAIAGLKRHKPEIEAEMRDAQKEVDQALAEASREMGKHGIKVDLSMVAKNLNVSKIGKMALKAVMDSKAKSPSTPRPPTPDN